MEAETNSARGYLASARQALLTAQSNLDAGDLVSSVNRSYYAIFYAANALLERDGLQRSKHSGVLALFRENYVKTGQIEPEFSDLYGQAFDTRIESDYDVNHW